MISKPIHNLAILFLEHQLPHLSYRQYHKLRNIYQKNMKIAVNFPF